MEACRKIFIEPNGINALINSMNSTNEMMVPEKPELSWSRHSASLQTGEMPYLYGHKKILENKL